MFEFDRRGYLKAGAYVPEVVVDHPHLVKNMYEEFVHAGSDVVEAFTVSNNLTYSRIFSYTVVHFLKCIVLRQSGKVGACRSRRRV